MSKDHRIDYLELPAADLDAAQRFYEAAFGWSFVDYGPDYRAFNDGALDGGFYRAPLQSRTSQGGVLVVLFSSDLEASLATVLAAGATLVKEIFDFPGGRRFHFADPNGNELAVWSDA
jgi:predicted enzyme related to lactoylglutathione lyase